MSTPTLITLPFHGRPLVTFELDGEHYAAMKPIAEGMGLDWSSQFSRIKRQQVLAATIVMMATVAEDGKTREMVSLPVRMLNGWLFGIDVERVKPELRDTILTYQRECYDALYRYWHEGRAVNPREAELPFDEIPAQTPFDRLSVTKMRELRKSGSKAAFQAYLISCGVTPEYVSGLLTQHGIPTLLNAPPDSGTQAAPLELLAREVPPAADRQDERYWYLLRETFTRVCGDYDVTATARMLAAHGLLSRNGQSLTKRLRGEAWGYGQGRIKFFAISKRLAQHGEMVGRDAA